MTRRRVNTTRLEIIQVATEMFLKRGFSETSMKAIADELDISTGNLTFYFPTKEHLLSVLAESMCNFQWQQMRHTVDEGKTSLMALCLELLVMATMSEENEVIKDFYLATYSHPMTLDIIRKNDAARAKIVFADYCPDWTDEQFREAEVLVSGIEYATLMTTEASSPLNVRIEGALNSIMMIYQVPEETRQMKLEKIRSIDYSLLGRHVLQEFMDYIEQVNEQAFEDLLNERKTDFLTHGKKEA